MKFCENVWAYCDDICLGLFQFSAADVLSNQSTRDLCYNYDNHLKIFYTILNKIKESGFELLKDFREVWEFSTSLIISKTTTCFDKNRTPLPVDKHLFIKVLPLS